MDHDLSDGRKETFRRLYHDRVSFDEVEAGFIDFSTASGRFLAMMCSKTGETRSPMLGGKLMRQHALLYMS